MNRRRSFLLAVGLLASLALLLPAPASAHAPCNPDAVVGVSFAIPGNDPVGMSPACSPGVSCASLGGCYVKIEGSISGIGIVGLEIVAAGTTPVSCGPLPRSCSVETERFFYSGGFVRCHGTTVAAVDVELFCRAVDA